MKFCKKGFYTDSGDPIKITYHAKIDDYGVIELVEDGKIDTDKEIQSYAESCDINLIINKYLAGDTSVLEKNRGMYGDFTNMPKTYAEFLQKQIDAENAFKRLPINIKEKFDNDINKFLATVGNEEWYEKLGFVNNDEKKDINISGSGSEDKE